MTIVKIIWMIIGICWGFMGLRDAISDETISARRAAIPEFMIFLFSLYIVLS